MPVKSPAIFLKKEKRKPTFFGALYLGWAGFVFVTVFLALYPLFMWFIGNKRLIKYTYVLNKIWSWIFFPAALMPIWVKRYYKPKEKKVVVYVSNHSSYMDIPMLTWVLPGFICFIGKSSLTKIPLFGKVFEGLHITVNRRDGKDRFQSMERAKDALDSGRSVIFFAEGTIHLEMQPQISEFKEGAFRTAIEKQLPIVPVCLPYNWIILPGDKTFSARFHKAEMTIFPAISTEGLTVENDLEALKAKVHSLLLEEMNKKNSPEKIKKYGGYQRIDS